MLPTLLLVAGLCPAQDAPAAQDADAARADQSLRAAVLDSLERAHTGIGYDVEIRSYDVDYGCDLGRVLLGHLARTEQAPPEVALDVVDLLEESADVGVGEAPLFQLSEVRARVAEAGERVLVSHLSEEGVEVHTTVVDGARRARYEAGTGALTLGPRGDWAGAVRGAEDIHPVPASGPWLRALERTPWVLSGGGALASLDRDGRRLDLAFDLADGEDGLVTRAVATYHGVRGERREAVLLGWELAGERWFLARAVRISAGEEVLRVRITARSAPRFDVDEADVVLAVPPPAAVQQAATESWRSFRRREAVPPSWRDLVRVER